MQFTSGSTAASYLALNIANSVVHALARRQVISFADAAEILERIADATLKDCESVDERSLATPCADWLKQVATSYKSEADNG